MKQTLFTTFWDKKRADYKDIYSFMKIVKTHYEEKDFLLNADKLCN